jgi:mono/diheme cytochrome c family protein
MKRTLILLAAALEFSGCRADPDRDLPAAYRSMTVPTERLEAFSAIRRGRALYVEHCALCHGVHADGRGVRREGLSTSPRDFTDVRWRDRFSPRRTFWILREGKPNTPMPSWRALAEDELWDLTAYILSVAVPSR